MHYTSFTLHITAAGLAMHWSCVLCISSFVGSRAKEQSRSPYPDNFNL